MSDVVTKREVMRRLIGGHFDHPSVYMGGPSKMALRRADDLIYALQEYGFLPADPALNVPFSVVKPDHPENEKSEVFRLSGDVSGKSGAG